MFVCLWFFASGLVCDIIFLHILFCCWLLCLRNLLSLPTDRTRESPTKFMAMILLQATKIYHPGSTDLAMPAYVDTTFIWRPLCSLASNFHTSHSVITTPYQAEFTQTGSPAYPTGLPALAPSLSTQLPRSSPPTVSLHPWRWRFLSCVSEQSMSFLFCILEPLITLNESLSQFENPVAISVWTAFSEVSV